MRKETTTRILYHFNELEEESQDKAVELLWDINACGEWWDSIYEDAATIGLKITEFDIDRGSYCRGEWTRYPDDVAKLIIENHGETCETHKNAVNFQAEYNKQKKIHESDDSYDPEYMEYDETSEYEELADKFLWTICEDYWIQLRKDYEYLSSREAIVEIIEANEYEFTVDGKLA